MRGAAANPGCWNRPVPTGKKRLHQGVACDADQKGRADMRGAAANPGCWNRAVPTGKKRLHLTG